MRTLRLPDLITLDFFVHFTAFFVHSRYCDLSAIVSRVLLDIFSGPLLDIWFQCCASFELWDYLDAFGKPCSNGTLIIKP
nr:unnamed protein product [Callosobruchus chinensis]